MKYQNTQDKNNGGFYKIGSIVLAAAIVVMLAMFFLPDSDKADPAAESTGSMAEESTGSIAEGASRSTDKWAEGNITYNEKTYKYNTSVKTYLFMGVDRPGVVTKAEDGISGGQSDVMFLLVVDKANEKLKVVAINRNSMCLVDMYDREGNFVGQNIAQICLQHGYGDGMGISCRRTVEAVERLFYDIPVSGYIALNMDGIRLLNKSVGGVTVTVEEDYTSSDGKYVFKAGETRKLTDDEAYAYIRSRDLEAFASADARLARQVNYMNALIDEIKAQMETSPGRAASIYKAVEDYTVASIDAVSLVEKIAGYSFEDEDMLQVPGETRKGTQFEEYHIDEKAFYDLVIDVFYTEGSK